MHKNRIWLGFLAFMTCVVLWFAGSTAYHLYNYWQLRKAIPPATLTWTVKSLSDEDFVAYADYTFFVEGIEYQGRGQLARPIFRNSWAVEQAIPELSSQLRVIWYNPSNPHHSALQKTFPLKECISTAMLVGLLLYFIWLGFYVGKSQSL